MVKIEAQEGVKAVADLRLLSKSWHQAFTQYRGLEARIVLHAKEAAHLLAVSELLADMSHLYLYPTKENMDLSPITSLSRLTSLQLFAYKAYRAQPTQTKSEFSISLLPTSLRELWLVDYAKLRHMDNLHLPYLTKLELFSPEKCDDDLAFLSKLRHLKVSLCV